MEIEETQIPEHLLLSVMRNRPPREFKAYCVGLAKTGTTSIANIFSNFYSRHEYLNAETGDMIKKFKNAVISKAVFRKFIIMRDVYAYCAMDSSSINYAYMDILMEEFPDAKFIFTIRDCYSWIDSIANYLLSSSKRRWFNPLSLEWINPFDRSVMNKDEINKRMHKLIDEALNCWGAENKKILDQLPPD